MPVVKFFQSYFMDMGAYTEGVYRSHSTDPYPADKSVTEVKQKAEVKQESKVKQDVAIDLINHEETDSVDMLKLDVEMVKANLAFLKFCVVLFTAILVVVFLCSAYGNQRALMNWPDDDVTEAAVLTTTERETWLLDVHNPYPNIPLVHLEDDAATGDE